MKKKKIFVCLPLRLQPILQYQILGWMHGSYMLEEPEEHQVLSKYRVGCMVHICWRSQKNTKFYLKIELYPFYDIHLSNNKEDILVFLFWKEINSINFLPCLSITDDRFNGTKIIFTFSLYSGLEDKRTRYWKNYILNFLITRLKIFFTR